MTNRPPLQPVKRRKLYEDIVAQLEAKMISGALSPGDQLPSERELMETFRVGRPSVREALFALQRRGLISIRNGERPQVTRPSASGLIGELSGAVGHMLADPNGIREFQHARVILEGSMARYAARHASDDDLVSLRAALQRNKDAIGNYTAFSDTDVEFHRQIIRVARNSIFDALHEGVSVWLAEQRLISTRDRNAERAAVESHLAILRAIEAHDPDAAEEAMRTHLEEVARFFWEQAADAGGTPK